MKRIFYISILSIFVLLTVSCKPSTLEKEISCQDLINAYSEYDEYSVTHVENSNEDAIMCFVKIEDIDGDYVYFEFYDTKEHALENEKKYNIAIWFISLLYGESRWLHTKTYNNINYEYFDSSLIKPFEDLCNN